MYISIYLVIKRRMSLIVTFLISWSSGSEIRHSIVPGGENWPLHKKLKPEPSLIRFVNFVVGHSYLGHASIIYINILYLFIY